MSGAESRQLATGLASWILESLVYASNHRLVRWLINEGGVMIFALH